MQRNLLSKLGLFLCFLAFAAGAAHAAGPCSNDLINQGFKSVYNKAPNGSGVSGECNPNLYMGVASMPLSTANAATYVQGSKLCASDPWIGEIYMLVYKQGPLYFDQQKCVIQHYNNGHWANNADLQKYIQAYEANPVKPVIMSPTKAGPGQVIIDDTGRPHDSAGNVLAPTQYQMKENGKLIQPHPGDIYKLVNVVQPTGGPGLTVINVLPK